MFLVLRFGEFGFLSKLKNECFFVLRFGKLEARSISKNEGFIRTLLSKFGILSVVVLSVFLFRFGKLVWCFARKSFFCFS